MFSVRARRSKEGVRFLAFAAALLTLSAVLGARAKNEPGH